MTWRGKISSDCCFLASHDMFPLPDLFRSLLLFITIGTQRSPYRGLSDKQNTPTQKGGFYHMKGKGRKEREKRRRGEWMKWEKIEVLDGVKLCMCVCEGQEGEIKAELYSLMRLLCVGSSQLQLQGLLHLHFSLKIAPVIIYLAGARHPPLCFQRIVFPLSPSHPIFLIWYSPLPLVSLLSSPAPPETHIFSKKKPVCLNKIVHFPVIISFMLLY